MDISVNNPAPEINSVAVIGNYLPRRCGIATFTTDLVESLSAEKHIIACNAVAMNDTPRGYDYPGKVSFEINQDNLKDYRTAAEFLNMNQVDIVCLQHEFGIFGGQSGDYILTLLQELQMPVVTTLHTVLVEPTKKQKNVMEQLVELSDRLVVMSQSAIHILHTLYDIPKEKIVYIPHGIPDIPFIDPIYYKDKFDLLGQKVLLTFGLLSENKGIEYVIKGLPRVVEKFPDLTYIVLGATHPDVLESEGEKYRGKLEQLVQKLDLEDHVVFKNQFVPFEELCDYLAATDLYITPYNNEEQITSGTLAYACGTGKAVISTPYWYAKEMLSDDRGRLVPFKDADAMADSIIELFENNTERHQMRKRAYDYNRHATWDEVASQYSEIFHEINSNQISSPKPKDSDRTNQSIKNGRKLPPIKLDHLLALTDDTGILQHAKYTIPDRNHGYCTDDNSRALIFAQQACRTSQIRQADEKQLETLSNRYLSFLSHAFNPNTGRFMNFMSYSREWLDSDEGSEDSHGRALWALGATASLSEQSPHVTLASTLFVQGIKAAESFKAPRAIAFSLIGLDSYLKTFSGDTNARRISTVLSERLFDQFTANKSDEWPWIENILTYSNGKLPHALILAGRLHQKDEMISMGLRSLSWLFKNQIEDDYLVPVGNHGWYDRQGKKARFDQQPLEAQGLLDACISAFKATGDERWLHRAKTCFNWFLGNNDLNLPLYDDRTGGCRDGLESNKVNENQGAESTLAWLLSLAAMHQISDEEILKPADLNLDKSFSLKNR